MTADSPTILATSGGLRPGTRTRFEFNKLVHHAVELSGVSGRAPRISHVGTASGDQRRFSHELSEAGRVAKFDLSHLNLFTMPNVGNIEEYLLGQDVVWVNGGSVVNLLAVWRAHGLDSIFRRVWEAGVVLAGVSAGSICWFKGGTTDSFGPELRAVDNGLALLPYDNGVHYDSEAARRPAVHRLVADGTLGRRTAPTTASAWSTAAPTSPTWSPKPQARRPTGCGSSGREHPTPPWSRRNWSRRPSSSAVSYPLVSR